MRSCAAHERMKMTLGKKFDNVCHYLAPVRFQSYLSALLKALISIEKLWRKMIQPEAGYLNSTRISGHIILFLIYDFEK